MAIGKGVSLMQDAFLLSVGALHEAVVRPTKAQTRSG